MTRRRFTARLEMVLFATAAVLLGTWLAVQSAGWITRERAFAALAAPAPVHAAPSLREAAAASGYVGRIEIARIGLDAVILPSADDRALLLGAGHLPGTALPDERGNVVLAGHRDGCFRPLKEVRVGDVVTLTTAVGTFDYRVASTRTVKPDQVEVLADTGEPLLTLITCWPFHYVGAAPKRFIVRATPVVASTAKLGSSLVISSRPASGSGLPHRRPADTGRCPS